MTKRTFKAVFLAALAGCLAAVVPILPAAANHVGCGAIITTNTVLDSDIGPCSGPGVRITASNISLNLNGHRIFGTANPGEGRGIHLFRVSGVTVMNGRVSDFDIGVSIEGGSGNTVTAIQAYDNIGSSDTIGGDGIAITGSQNNQIVSNHAINNGGFSGIGIYSVIGPNGISSGNLIQSNQVINNIASRFGDVTTTDNIGIRVEPNSSGNSIIGNAVNGNGLDGITLFVGANNNVIRGNAVHRNGLYRTTARRGNGIGLQSLNNVNGPSGNLIENNFVTQNGDNGIVLRGPRGTGLGATNNIVRNNTAVQNATLPLLGPAFGPAFDLNDNNPNCDNNVWRGNRYQTANPPCTTTP